MFKFSATPQSFWRVVANGFSIYKSTLGRVWIFALIAALVQQLPLIVHSQFSHLRLKVYFADGAAFVAMYMLLAYFLPLVMHRAYLSITQETSAASLSFKSINLKYPLLLGAIVLSTVLYLLGGVIFVLPGVLLYVLLILYMPAILFEGKGVWGSLGRSCRLVTGNWWRTFGVMLVAILIIGIIQIFVSQLLQSTDVFIQAAADVILGTFLFVPYFAAVVLAQYSDLKAREVSV